MRFDPDGVIGGGPPPAAVEHHLVRGCREGVQLRWSRWAVRDRDDRWYDRVAADRGGERLFGRIEARVASAQRPSDSWPADTLGSIPTDLGFLVSTSDLGLLEYRHGRFSVVLPGHTFGIGALPAGRGALGFQVTGRHGRLALVDGEATSQARPATLLWGLTRGVHQVSVRGDDVLVADTYRNRLILFSLQDLMQGKGQNWRAAARRIAYPAGKLTAGQRSPNYRHFNSVLPLPSGGWLVMAHNDTTKTGRMSQIYTLDADLRVTEIAETGGSDCHDLVLDSAGQLMFCRSGEGTVVVGGRSVLSVPMFTRGLAVGPDLVLVGGSPRGDRAQRRAGTAAVYVLNRRYLPLGCLNLPGTQVHDVHLLPAGPARPT